MYLPGEACKLNTMQTKNKLTKSKTVMIGTKKNKSTKIKWGRKLISSRLIEVTNLVRFLLVLLVELKAYRIAGLWLSWFLGRL